MTGLDNDSKLCHRHVKVNYKQDVIMNNFSDYVFQYEYPTAPSTCKYAVQEASPLGLEATQV